MKKRILAMLMTLVMLLSLFPAAAVADEDDVPVDPQDPISGSFGNDLTWVLEENGIFNIYGSGEMPDWSSREEVPWHAYRESITEIWLPPELTSIGSYAFADCINADTISIRAFVTSIGDYAVSGCCFSLAYYEDTMEAWNQVRIGEGNEWFETGPIQCADGTIHEPEAEAELVASGDCGENVSWTLDSEGTLAISGAGPMEDFYKENEDEVPPMESVAPEETMAAGALSPLTATDPARPQEDGLREAPWSGMYVSQISLEDGITHIGSYAFADCSSAYWVYIPASVTSIGNYAFSGCGLSDATYGDTIENWNQIQIGEGNDWFAAGTIYCTDGTINEPNEDPGYTEEPTSGSCGDALYWDLDVESGVLTISGSGDMWEWGDGAAPWESRSGEIQTVMLGAELSSVCSCAFLSGSTREILVDEENASFASRDGVLYSKDLTRLIRCPAAREEGLQIPEGVSSLAPYAFAYASNLTEIRIPEGITAIPDHAFCSCPLESVRLPEGLETIGSSAFENCRNVTELSIPSGVTEIGGYAFSACSSLSTLRLPAGLTRVGEEAFGGDDALQTVLYGGSEEQRGQICYGEESGLELLRDAEWIYNYDPAMLVPLTVEPFAGGTARAEGLILGNLVARGEKIRLQLELLPGYQLSEIRVNGVAVDLDSYVVGDEEEIVITVVTEELRPGSEALSSGKHGDNLTWTLYQDGLLLISGSGEMESRENGSEYGWYFHSNEIRAVQFEEGVSSVGSQAFAYAYRNLTSVSLPAGIRSIGNYAFAAYYSGNALQTLIWNGAPTEIGDGAFQNCRNLGGELVLPEGLVSIGACAFQKTGLSSVTLPETVESLGINAFTDCSQLTEISLPDGLQTIGDYAFNACTSLRSVSLPQGLHSLGNGAFQNCSALSGEILIPEGITKIKEWTFKGCGIQSVILSEGVTEIGDSAFDGCGSLVSVTLPESLQRIGEGAFIFCSSLASASLPAGVNEIGPGAFSGCSGLKSVRILGNITEIPSNCFYNCSNLESVTIPASVRSIGTNAFLSCSKLQSVIIPEGMTTIGKNCFSGCSGIQWVSLPASLQSVDYSAFSSAKDVLYAGTEEQRSGITNTNGASGTLLPNATWHYGKTAEDIVPLTVEMPENAYVRASSLAVRGEKLAISVAPDPGFTLEQVYVNGQAIDLESYVVGQEESVTVSFRITRITGGSYGENLVWSIDQETGTLTISGAGDMEALAHQPWEDFRDMIRAVVIEPGVTGISHYAFSMCSNLESVSIPEGVTSIGNGVFDYCPMLTSLTIPGSVTSIGSAPAFCGITEITYGGTRAAWKQMLPDYHNYGVTIHCSDGNILPVADNQCGDNLFWTDENGVRTISGTGDMWDSEPFSGSRTAPFTSLVVEEGVTSIGAYAFCCISNLSAVSLPSTLQRIGEEAFKQCPMNEIHIPGTVTSLGREALNFYSQSIDVYYTGTTAQWREAGGSVAIMPYFTTVHCQDNEIPKAASNQCGDNLTWSLNGSWNTLTVTGTGDMWKQPYWQADPGPQYYETVILEEGVTSIGQEAFSYCSKLSSVRLPNTLRRIDNLAFVGCGALKSIILPASLEVLGLNALAGSGLTEIYFRGSAPEIGWQCFGGLTATVYYPRNDPSWTEEVRQDYMGTITWVPYDPPEFEVLASGECGDDLTWTLDNRGTLTVSGTGPMWDSSADVEFWQSYSSQISAVVVEEGATSLREGAFSSCEGLKSVSLPESLETIGDFAFSYCSKLEEILLPKGVKTVGHNIFYYCRALREIRVTEENPWLCSVDGVLYDKSADTLILITCPMAKSGEPALPEGLTAIEEGAFRACQIEKITIPASVTSIGDLAFSGCDKLTEIRFAGKAPQIGTSAFSGVTATVFYPEDDDSWTGEIRQGYGGNLTWHEGEYVILGSGQCGDNAFWSMCEDGVLTISGTGAMWDYGPEPENLPVWLRDHAGEIKVIRIEEGITHVGANTFKTGYYSVMAESIELPDSLLSVGDYAFWQSACASVKLPAGLQAIGEEAFGLAAISGELRIPGTVERIGQEAFWDCLIETLVVEDGVREIGNLAFARNTRLTKAYIPASVTAIESQALAKGCVGLTDVWYDGTRAQWQQIAAPDAVERQITTVHCTDGDILPAAMDRCGDDLTWSLENGVLTVTGTGDMWDFGVGTQPWLSRGSEIRTVVLSEGVTTVGNYAFESFPNGLRIEEVQLPESLERIGEFAFSRCFALVSITIPANVESICDFAIYSCRSMMEILVDEDNAHFCSINGALYTKDGLTLVAYPGGRAGEFVTPPNTTALGSGALSGASGVTEVTVSAKVNQVGDSAFQDCTSLNTVRFTGSAPKFGSNVFKSVTATAYYPENDETWTEAVRQDYGGEITWEAVAPVFDPGDVNGDGELDDADVLFLIRYVRYGDQTLDGAALDVNGDGEVDNRDVTRLIRYIRYPNTENP